MMVGGGNKFPPKRRKKIPTIIHGVTCQYTAVFVVGLRPFQVRLGDSAGESVVNLFSD